MEVVMEIIIYYELLYMIMFRRIIASVSGFIIAIKMREVW